MLFSNSPVKKVAEKLNPYSQKNKVSRLKFERKSDYRTFLKFIKDNTKEVEDIKLPDEKKKTGLLAAGGLGLGLLALTAFRGRGRGSGSGLEDGENVAADALEKSGMQSKKATPEIKRRRNLSTIDDPLIRQREARKTRKIVKKKYEEKEKKIKKLKSERRKTIKKKLNIRSTRRNLKNIEQFEKKFGIKRQQLDINPRTGEPYTRYDPEIGMAPEDNRGKTKKVNPFGINDPVDDSFNKPKKTIDKKFKQTTIDEFFKKAPEPFDTNKDLKRIFDMNIDEPTRMSDKDFKNLSKFIRGDISSDDLDEIIKINRIFDADDDKPLKLFDRKIPLEERVMYNPNQNRAGGTKLTKVTPPKLNMFDKITKFSNQILNSGIAKGIFSLSNLIYNPKAFLLYSVVRPTPLADGTLEGKPGVYDSEQFIFDEDMAVNIFMPPEERESMIPFDANITPPPDTPTDLQAPNNSVFIDYDFNTSEDLFFIKMAGS